MSILIYKNVSDSGMKAFFSIPDLIVQESKNEELEVFSHRTKSSFYEKIKDFSTLIFVTHGDKENIYHNYYEDDSLISLTDLDKLNNKKIIAISCATAATLGKEACDSNCLVYLGMKHSIHRDIKNNDRAPENAYIRMIDNVYKNAFSKSLTISIDRNFTFNKIKNILEIELIKHVEESNRLEKERNSRQYNLCKLKYTIEAVTNVVNNLLLHGNGELTII